MHLIVSDFKNKGGAEVVAQKQFDTLKSLGLDVHWFSPDESHRNPLTYIYNYKLKKHLKDIIEKHSIKYIWLHNYHHLLSPSVIRVVKKLHCKIIYTAHDYHLVCPNPSFQHFVNDKGVNFSPSVNDWKYLRYCLDKRGGVHSLLRKLQWFLNYKFLKSQNQLDYICAPSNFLKQLIENRTPSECRLLRNPTMLNLPQVIECGPFNKGVHLLLLSRLSHEKGVLEFIELLAKINFKYVDKITIVGDGPDRDNVVDLACKYSEKIDYLGAVKHDEVMHIISDCDILAIPSLWYENAPMTILEAASLGKPVLVHNIGSIGSFSKEVGNGVLFDFNETSLLNVLSRLCNEQQSLKLDNLSFSPDVYTKELQDMVDFINE